MDKKLLNDMREISDMVDVECATEAGTPAKATIDTPQFRQAIKAVGLSGGEYPVTAIIAHIDAALEARAEEARREAEHQRNLLAEAIRDAAVKAGIARADADLTGPHLLMLTNDMAEALGQRTAGEDAETYQHLANDWAGAAYNGLQWLKNVKDGIPCLDEAIANMTKCVEDMAERWDAAQRPPAASAAVPGDAVAWALKRMDKPNEYGPSLFATRDSAAENLAKQGPGCVPCTVVGLVPVAEAAAQADGVKLAERVAAYMDAQNKAGEIGPVAERAAILDEVATVRAKDDAPTAQPTPKENAPTLADRGVDEIPAQAVTSAAASVAQPTPPDDERAKLEALANDLEDEAQPYEGDFADAVRGHIEALRELAALRQPGALPDDAVTELLAALDSQEALRRKIRAAGPAPHPDYWHQSIDEARERVEKARTALAAKQAGKENGS